MSENIDLKPIKDKLEANGTVLVLFGNHATVDHVAAALSLYLILKEQANKEVFVSSPATLRTEFSRLVGLDQIKDNIGNRNLVIGFNQYDPGSIEKVSHNDGNNNRFELIIQPKPGQKAPDAKNIEFSYRGVDANLIFVIGTNRLEDLGPIYESERKLFNEATTVSFNRRQSPNFAAISVVDNESSSLSEMVFEFIEKLGYSPKGDIASNLLAGIDFSTNRFENPVISASAFIAAGKLLQNGAKRQPPRISSLPNTGNFTGKPPFLPFTPATQPAPQQSQPNFNQPQQANQNGSQQQPQTQPNDQQPPKDWLQPKIYKGSTRV